MGVAPGPSDNLVFDIQNGVSSSGFGHPDCKGGNPSKKASLSNSIKSYRSDRNESLKVQ